MIFFLFHCNINEFYLLLHLVIMLILNMGKVTTFSASSNIQTTYIEIKSMVKVILNEIKFKIHTTS